MAELIKEFQNGQELEKAVKIPLNPKKALDTSAYEMALINGNLAGLSEEQRLNYVKNLCESLGLNIISKPFEYIVLNGKLTLYATKSATEQLRQLKKVSVTKLEQSQIGDVYQVRAYVCDGEGRVDCATGAVNIARLTGDALANALMKAETKAKRRATLSICGLGFLDESELESIPASAKQSFKEAVSFDERAIKQGLSNKLSELGLHTNEQKDFIIKKVGFELEKMNELLNDDLRLQKLINEYKGV